MPHLILSDIHSNVEALEAVMADAQGRYDSILCLGDLVGYGAEPNPVVEWVRANTQAVVRGNHDKACSGLDPLHIYNPAARSAMQWTMDRLTPESLAYLQQLPRGPLRVAGGNDGGGFDLSHGSPLDEDEYLISLIDVAPLRADLQSRITFFGHTHVQGGFLLARNGSDRLPAERTLELEPDYFYLINPGSVGQPRDRDPRAAYALYDPEARTVEYHRVAYDIEKTAAKIRAAGLPDMLAARLFVGA